MKEFQVGREERAPIQNSPWKRGKPLDGVQKRGKLTRFSGTGGLVRGKEQAWARKKKARTGKGAKVAAEGRWGVKGVGKRS